MASPTAPDFVLDAVKIEVGQLGHGAVFRRRWWPSFGRKRPSPANAGPVASCSPALELVPQEILVTGARRSVPRAGHQHLGALRRGSLDPGSPLRPCRVYPAGSDQRVRQSSTVRSGSRAAAAGTSPPAPFWCGIRPHLPPPPRPATTPSSRRFTSSRPGHPQDRRGARRSMPQEGTHRWWSSVPAVPDRILGHSAPPAPALLVTRLSTISGAVSIGAGEERRRVPGRRRTPPGPRQCQFAFPPSEPAPTMRAAGCALDGAPLDASPFIATTRDPVEWRRSRRVHRPGRSGRARSRAASRGLPALNNSAAASFWGAARPPAVARLDAADDRRRLEGLHHFRLFARWSAGSLSCQ